MMKDIRALIDQVMGTVREKQSKHFEAQIYRDEPILRPASHMAGFLPPIYREMRKLAAGFDYYRDSEASLFYKQAKLMEHHTDDYDYRGEFIRYFPTYQAMNDDQLRGYFSWRTKVRQGDVQKTSLSFVFVYIYELLHQIGVTSDEEGFDTLHSFWVAYREHDAHIDRYISLWLHDYIIYYGLDHSFLEKISDTDFDEALAVLTHAETADDTALFAAADRLSTYHFNHSKLYKQRPEDVVSVVCGLLRAVTGYYAKHRKNSYVEKLFGKQMEGPYLMFHSAVFHDRKRYEDYVYEIAPAHRYTCQQGKWRVMRHFGSRTPSKELGVLLKTVDSVMRKEFGVKPLLKQEPETKLIAGMLRSELERLQEEKRQAAARRVEIDRSKLGGIRRAAFTTQEKLIVEEIEEMEEPTVSLDKPILPPVAPVPADQPPSTKAAIPGLEENGVFLLSCLLRNEDYAEGLKARGVMLSVLVDSINEALFDTFGDTVLLSDGEQPTLIEDYREELEELLL